MNYFGYVKEKNIKEIFEIYQVVQSLKGYAISIYKGLWEDAIDKSFFHIVENYDSEKGDLEHYAIRVVGTILLNKYSKEVTQDLVLETSLDKKSYEEDLCSSESEAEQSYFERYSRNPSEDTYLSNDLNGCINYLTPRYIIDYKFFVTKSISDKKLDYKEMFNTYSPEVIKSAIDYLNSKYFEDISELKDTSKKCRARKFPSDRWEKNKDTNIEILGMLNGILIYKRTMNSHNRVFYSLSIPEVVDSIINNIYVPDSIEGYHLHKRIEKFDVFCTISGKLVVGIETLCKELEKNIVTKILTYNTFLKVAIYNNHSEIVFSCTKDLDKPLFIDIFGVSFSLKLTKVIAKRI